MIANLSVEERSQWRLGEIMIQNGWLSWNQLEEGLQLQKQFGGFIGEILVNKGYVEQDFVFRALSIQFNIPFVKLEGLQIQENALSILPKRLAYEYQIVPLIKMGSTLLVAVSDPIDQIPIEKIRESSKIGDVRFVLAHPEDIRKTLKRLYGPEGLEMLQSA